MNPLKTTDIIEQKLMTHRFLRIPIYWWILVALLLIGAATAISIYQDAIAYENQAEIIDHP